MAGKIQKAPSAKQLQAEATAALDDRIRQVLEESSADALFPITGDALSHQVGSDWMTVQKRLGSAKWKPELALLNAKDAAAPLALKNVEERLYQHPRTLAYLAEVVSAKRKASGANQANTLTKFISEAKLPSTLKPRFTAHLERQLAAGQLDASLVPLIDIKPTPAQRVVQLTNAIRSLADTVDYPLTESAWIRLADPTMNHKDFLEAMKLQQLSSLVVVCKAGLDGKQVAYALREHVATADKRLLDNAFDAAVRISQSGKSTKPSLGFTAQKLAEAVIKTKADQQTMVDALWAHLEKGTLDGTYASLFYDGQRIFFRRRDVTPPLVAANAYAAPSAPASTRSMATSSSIEPFATAFDTAFQELDSRQGRRNFVKVHALRQALSHFTREQFDEGLRQLRLANRYTMDSAFGASSSPSEVERAAGIQEGQSLLVYVSRR